MLSEFRFFQNFEASIALVMAKHHYFTYTQLTKNIIYSNVDFTPKFMFLKNTIIQYLNGNNFSSIKFFSVCSTASDNLFKFNRNDK